MGQVVSGGENASRVRVCRPLWKLSLSLSCIELRATFAANWSAAAAK